MSAYRFHALDFSYFSAKVRPALRYKGLWYEEVRPDFREIKRRTGLHFIPIVVTPEDETWQDSTDIYDHLEERHPEPPLFPGTPVQRIAAHLVELYADEFALLPAMHYRWANELGSRTTEARFSAHIGSPEIGKAAAERMRLGRIAIGATDQTAPAIEAHTHEVLDALSAHFRAHPFLLGERMSFADCALMGPLYAHLFVDLVPRQLLLETAVPVVGWIDRCHAPDAGSQGEWLADDEVGPTLCEVLRATGRDAAPVILDTVGGFEAWADERPADVAEPPRAAGRVETSLRGVPFSRGASSYALWSLQRVTDAYAALDEPARKRVDETFAGTGWDEVLAYRPRHRLAKRDFALAFA